MEQIASGRGRRVWIEEIRTAAEFSTPRVRESYVCVLWDNESGFDSTQRTELATALLNSGCQYAVCAGTACEAWHDEIDAVYLSQHSDQPQDDGSFVMTTWHTDESEEDVMFFAFHCTNLAEHDFTNFLVLLVGQNPVRRECIERLVHSAA
ncbi:MAG: hypothetical protein ACLQGV_05975 [Bryobacteraceae bacterium]